MSRTRQAAAEIVALINASPRSPRVEEIEAILANIVPSSTAPATPLLTEIRETAVRLEDAFAVYAECVPRHPNEEALQARIDQIQSELEGLGNQIPNPPQTFTDLVAWAEIARAGADVHADGTMGEVGEDDVFLRPAARLVEAVLQFPGATSIAAMSPAHAAHYQEWRTLIDTHIREFENIDQTGWTKVEIDAEEVRNEAHTRIVDAMSKRILDVPARTWGDVALYAQVCMWEYWAGTDPESAEARCCLLGQEPPSEPEETNALGKLLEAIFTVAGVGQFAEERSQP